VIRDELRYGADIIEELLAFLQDAYQLPYNPDLFLWSQVAVLSDYNVGHPKHL